MKKNNRCLLVLISSREEINWNFRLFFFGHIFDNKKIKTGTYRKYNKNKNALIIVNKSKCYFLFEILRALTKTHVEIKKHRFFLLFYDYTFFNYSYFTSKKKNVITKAGCFFHLKSIITYYYDWLSFFLQ